MVPVKMNHDQGCQVTLDISGSSIEFQWHPSDSDDSTQQRIWPRRIGGSNISSANRMAWQWAETLVEIRETLVDIRGTTK